MATHSRAGSGPTHSAPAASDVAPEPVSVHADGDGRHLLRIQPQRTPGIVCGTFLKIDGRVASVAGGSLVVTITANAEMARPGFSFAVHDGRRYKGEFVLEEVRSDGTAKGTLRHRVDDTVVVAGDLVSTDPR